ncbi:MAG: asparagine--tRNA ligase [Candidatus Riflebacteria bacterium]|nr:asparagine--tRNA ligase [Candidatus Riflebacteria bacterium]
MKYTYISDLKDHVGKEVTIAGWLYNKRSSGKVRFVIVRDGTGICQTTAFKPEVDPAVFETCDKLDQETSLKVTGVVRKDDRAPGGYELSIKEITILGESKDFPISPKEHGVAFLMENRHLWLRSIKQHATLRVRHQVIKAVRDFFDNRGFTLLDTPILTANACEGTTTLFETDYFGQKAYLSQSGQLYNEANAMAFGKVYCFGPTFRAEKSKTRRHLTEFWMVEPEVAFMDLEGNMDLAEEFVEYVVGQVVEKCRNELKILERDITKLECVKRPFPRISYAETQKFLQTKKEEYASSADPELKKLSEDMLKNGLGDDLGAADETAIGINHDRPVMVHRYPSAVKAFYMKNDPQNPEYALCVDVIAPEGVGEIIGGGQREESLEVLEGKIKHHGLPLEAFKWYLDLRRYGTVPHSGFGMGIERMVTWVTGTHHVRETIPFPRLMDTIWP